MTPHLDVSAGWRGAELFDRPDWNRSLANAEIGELLDVAEGFGEGEKGDVLFQGKPLDKTDEDDFPLRSLASKLRQMQTDLEEGSGASVIRGFPVEAVSESKARGLFWAFCCHVGTPVSQSAAGDRIFSVRDVGYQADDPRSRGPNTRKRLSFHTDRCDVIGFLCLKQAKSGGENEIVSSVALYNEIRRRRPELLRTLMEPYYYQRHTVDLGNDLPYCRQPVFSFCEDYFAASFLRVLIERAYDSSDVPPMTPIQKEALDFLEHVAGDPNLHVGFLQKPGDILFLNNWVTFHRRTEFEDFDEPDRKRHLLRVWLSVPNSRPLAHWFRENYGATERGALRGGMKKA